VRSGEFTKRSSGGGSDSGGGGGGGSGGGGGGGSGGSGTGGEKNVKIKGEERPEEKEGKREGGRDSFGHGESPSRLLLSSPPPPLSMLGMRVRFLGPRPGRYLERVCWCWARSRRVSRFLVDDDAVVREAI